MTKKNDEKKDALKTEAVKELANKLLTGIGLTGYEIVVEEDNDTETVMVKITLSQPGLLIGFRGKTLSALQLILNYMVNNGSESWQRVIVDVNGYREEQKDRLSSLALDAAAKVKETQSPVCLPPMSSYERRLIHILLADDPQIDTTSEGEGEERKVVVKLKNNNEA